MSARVGLVLVSHSRALAEAARGLATEASPGQLPPMAVAAGMPDGGFGTDAAAVAMACEEVLGEVGADPGHGVVVLTDLGSAVLSAEMALEFLSDPDAPVRLAAAPFVEGTLAACISAGGGADLDTVLAQARGSLAPKVEQILGPDAEEGTTAGSGVGSAPVGEPADGAVTREVTLINEAGLHARPAAQVAHLASQLEREFPDLRDLTVAVAGGKPVAADSPMGLAGLGTRAGDAVTVSASGEHAEEAVDRVAGIIAAGFGEADPTLRSTSELSSGPESVQTPSNGARSGDAGAAGAAGAGRRGVGVSPGRVVGQVARMAAAIAEPAGETVAEGDRPAEAERIRAAAEAVAARLQERADAATGEAAEILSTTASLVTDPSVLADAEDGVKNQGLDAASAVWRSFGDAATALAAVGGRTAERATDVLDVRARLVAELTGQTPPGLPDAEHPYVLVARDLAPADTAGIDSSLVLGILCSEGGPTSHTAILARSLGIPAVVGSPSAASVASGQTVLLDGGTGEVVIDPSDELASGARSTPAPRVKAEPLAGPVHTSDGHHVAVRANVGGPGDVQAAVDAGSEGVGLFRTEFLFLDRASAPSEDEQASLYAQVLAGLAGSKVVVRTLDAGSDKPLPFLNDASEENPALGVRGLRTSWTHPDVLSTQLAAIAKAAAQCPDTEVWVMAPMVATAEEASWFASTARGAGLATVGVMVETPAAAVMSAAVMDELDFVSLGTNDLTQYVMAADRVSAPLAQLNDPWQPAVLRLIASTVAGSHGKSVGVCGEAAADPLLAPVLVGLGVDSLSMNAAAVPVVGRVLAGYSLQQCRDAAEAALAADTAAEVRAAVGSVLGRP
ncbi:MAG: phosphoenolpyruvate--protein phosphotransferase [Galactobacter sp.]